MQLLKVLILAAAMLAAAGQYLQETRRLAIIKRMSGPDGRAYYERTRQRSEKLLLVVAIVLGLVATAVALHTFVLS